jgi:hypothetical protein
MPRLGHDRKTDAFGERDRLGGGGELLAARRHRNAGRFGEPPGRQLVAHRFDGRRSRPDKDDACFIA